MLNELVRRLEEEAAQYRRLVESLQREIESNELSWRKDGDHKARRSGEQEICHHSVSPNRNDGTPNKM